MPLSICSQQGSASDVGGVWLLQGTGLGPKAYLSLLWSGTSRKSSPVPGWVALCTQVPPAGDSCPTAFPSAHPHAEGLRTAGRDARETSAVLVGGEAFPVLKGKKVYVLGPLSKHARCTWCTQSEAQEKASIAAVTAGSLVSGLDSLPVLIQCQCP